MEPFEHDELSPQELDDLLKQWQAPSPPPHLRAALFPQEPLPWWKRLWTISIRVPLPVACCLAILFAIAAWRLAQPAPERSAAPARQLTFTELKPVSELRLRIIRRQDAKN